MGIDCDVEGQMGRAFAGDANDPTVFLIEQGGIFAYLAGAAHSPAGRALAAALSGPELLIPAYANPPADTRLPAGLRARGSYVAHFLRG